MSLNDNTAQERSPYSYREVECIYALARFHFENGNLKLAEPLFRGITIIAPSFFPAWLGIASISILEKNFDQGLMYARSAYKASSKAYQALLLEVVCLLSLKDLTAAGTLLGEINEFIESGQLQEPCQIRLYNILITRFQVMR